MSLIKQHSKQEWIQYGAYNTRVFFAIAKQRKLVSYIYTIMDAEANQVEGFEKVEQVMV